MFRVFVAILILRSSVGAMLEPKEPITKRLYFEVGNMDSIKNQFDKSYFNMGYNPIRETYDILGFSPDLNSINTILNMKGSSSDSWGISCANSQTTPSTTENCIFDKNKQNQDTYQNLAYQFYPAKSYAVITESGQRIEDSAKPFEFNLAVGLEPTFWKLNQNGVLGFSPSQSNKLWNYLFNLYQFKSNKFIFSLSFSVGDKNHQLEPSDKKSLSTGLLFLNGYDEDSVSSKGIYYSNQPENATSWTVEDTQIHLDKKQSSDSLSVRGIACLTNTQPELLALQLHEMNALTSKVCTQMCGASTCGSCLDYSKAPSLHISIAVEGNDVVEYIFPPSSYIYSKDGITKLSVACIEEWKSVGTDGCDKNSTIGLGKLFLAKTSVIFEVYKNLPGNVALKKIGFAEKFRIPRSTKAEKWLLTVFILICLLVLLAVFLLKLFSKPKLPVEPKIQEIIEDNEEKEANYFAIEDGDHGQDAHYISEVSEEGSPEYRTFHVPEEEDSQGNHLPY